MTKRKTILATLVLAMLMCFMFVLGVCLSGATPVAHADGEAEIATVNIIVTAPVGGKTPDMNPKSGDPEKYDITFHCWYIANGDLNYARLTETDKFYANATYTLRFYVDPKPGYVLSSDVTFKWDGAEVRAGRFASNRGYGINMMATNDKTGYINVVDGNAYNSAGEKINSAKPGEEVTIVADDKSAENKSFDHWYNYWCVNGMKHSDQFLSPYTFTMTENSIDVVAIYKDETVVPDPVFNATVDPILFEDLSAGYSEVTAENVKITNTGSRVLRNPEVVLSGENADKFELIKLASPEIISVGKFNTSWQVKPLVGLEIGEYAAQVQFTCDEIVEPVVASVTLSVKKETHIHNMISVPFKGATCFEEGRKAFYECEECGKKFEDETGLIQITDESTLVIPKAHKFGEWIAEVSATEETAGVKAHKDCELCGKHFDNDGNEIEDLTIAKLPSGGEQGDGEQGGNDGEVIEPKDEGLSGGAIAGIVIGAVVVVAVGGFAIFWFVVKKKEFADLGELFKKK